MNIDLLFGFERECKNLLQDLAHLDSRNWREIQVEGHARQLLKTKVVFIISRIAASAKYKEDPAKIADKQQMQEAQISEAAEYLEQTPLASLTCSGIITKLASIMKKSKICEEVPVFEDAAEVLLRLERGEEIGVQMCSVFVKKLNRGYKFWIAECVGGRMVYMGKLLKFQNSTWDPPEQQAINLSLHTGIYYPKQVVASDFHAFIIDANSRIWVIGRDLWEIQRPTGFDIFADFSKFLFGAFGMEIPAKKIIANQKTTMVISPSGDINVLFSDKHVIAAERRIKEIKHPASVAINISQPSIIAIFFVENGKVHPPDSNNTALTGLYQPKQSDIQNINAIFGTYFNFVWATKLE